MPDPTYHDLGDHTEVVRVEFDPSRITYSALLDVFFSSHDPFWSSLSVQYRSVILTVGEEQARLALSKRAAVSASGSGSAVRTSVEPLGTFTSAESYHQKYRLQAHPDLMAELLSMYTAFDDLVDSTVAARLNGYLSGYGTRAELEAEIESFGLSTEMMDHLRDLTGGLPPGCGAPVLGISPVVYNPLIPRP